MSFRILAVLATIVALATYGARPTRATLLVHGASAQRAARADAVIVGRVESTAAGWSGGRIVTRAQVSTELALAGTAPLSLEVIAPGGTVDGIGMRVIGAPELRAGDRAVFFLDRARVLDLASGVMAIERGADGIDRVRDDHGQLRRITELAAEMRR